MTATGVAVSHAGCRGTRAPLNTLSRHADCDGAGAATQMPPAAAWRPKARYAPRDASAATHTAALAAVARGGFGRRYATHKHLNRSRNPASPASDAWHRAPPQTPRDITASTACRKR